MVAKAQDSGNPSAIEAAGRAQRELDWIWDSITVLPRYQYDDLWPAGDFNAYRWVVAEQILAVQRYLE